MKTINLKEDFFHYLWKTKSFNFLDLKSVSGEAIEILNFGTHNHNAGPDFLNGSISISKQLWVGNIEIHVKSSDWYKHGHQNDPAYNAVILHVSYVHDRDIINANGQLIPCLELHNRISPKLIANYEHFLDNKSFIPCEASIHEFDPQALSLFKEQLIIERLEYKIKTAERIFKETKGNWLETMYRLIARSLGANINQDAFETLARICPVSQLMKHRDIPKQVMAMLFGQASILHDNDDVFTKELIAEYSFLSRKYKLRAMNYTSWKYMRMRPDSFPDLRIAWLSELVLSMTNLFDRLIYISDYNELRASLKLELNAYWNNRYTFRKASKRNHPKRSSTEQINRIIINAVVPLKFLYAQKMDLKKMQAEAINLLREVHPEKNKFIRSWKMLGITCKNAFDSQALLHLYQNYCKFDACLNCKVGHALIQKKNQ